MENKKPTDTRQHQQQYQTNQPGQGTRKDDTRKGGEKMGNKTQQTMWEKNRSKEEKTTNEQQKPGQNPNWR